MTASPVSIAALRRGAQRESAETRRLKLISSARAELRSALVYLQVLRAQTADWQLDNDTDVVMTRLQRFVRCADDWLDVAESPKAGA